MHRHDKFYFADGSAIFKVENTLYKLHMSLLQPSSVVFANMFSMPTREGVSEGDSDENAIRLGAPFTVQKFNHLLEWYYRVGPQFPSIEGLMAILELATFLEMEVARAFAVQALSVPNMGLSSARRLSLALSFRISDWIAPSFRDLIVSAPDSVTDEDWSMLGGPITRLITLTQKKIRIFRLTIAYNPFQTPTHDPSCKRPVIGCQCSWEAAWWDGFAKHYLHPDYPASPGEALSKLEKTTIVGVTSACQRNAVRIIREGRVFDRENDIVDDALEELRHYEGTVFCA